MDQNYCKARSRVLTGRRVIVASASPFDVDLTAYAGACNQNFIHPPAVTPRTSMRPSLSLQFVDFKRFRRLANRHGFVRQHLPGIFLLQRAAHNLASQSPWTKLGIVTCGMLFFVHVITVFMPGWTYFEDRRISASAGPFNVCFKNSEQEQQKTSNAFFGFYEGYLKIPIPTEIIYDWMVTSRVLTCSGLAVFGISFSVIVYHSLTTKGVHNLTEEGDASGTNWLLAKEYTILICLFCGSFLSILAILFWHGASCEICSWLHNVALSAKVDTINGQVSIDRKTYDGYVETKMRMANQLPNRVQKETVYVGHAMAERDDEEAAAVGFNLETIAEAPSLFQSTEDGEVNWLNKSVGTSSSNGNGETFDVQIERNMEFSRGGIREGADIRMKCYATSSVIIIFAGFFVNIIYIVLVLATIGGHFLTYRTYPVESFDNNYYYHNKMRSSLFAQPYS